MTLEVREVGAGSDPPEEIASVFSRMQRWVDGVSLKMKKEWDLEGEIERRFCGEPDPEDDGQMPWR